ncbi:predicted protein [Lichtheimia corymbifera JMRC:FSU:9682]|uniref:Uncharacterized protein n=1 Tax=Lichtheimia corymbifera JMRC:FSU:9682 TaxID=1263082 RepID=A0A068SC18_9FUNG|nr:predicted protein [Lichtheimia corymbifera JMRC:FSU:9682]
MCLPCRKVHYQCYPETGCSSPSNKREKFGGQVGVDAEEKKRQVEIEKLTNKVKEEVAGRREKLKSALQATRHEIVTKNNHQQALYIQTGEPRLPDVVRQSINSVDRELSKRERYNKLRDLLMIEGIPEAAMVFNPAKDWVNTGHGKLKKVVKEVIQFQRAHEIAMNRRLQY